MKRYLHKLLSEALGNMYENGQIFDLPSFEIGMPKEGFGDYTTSVAFAIAREGKFNPNEVANILSREIKSLDKENAIEEAKALGGFINISISKEYLAKTALSFREGIEIEQLGKPEGKPLKVVFEYSSPNTNKPLHIGHTRNDVFGMACINLLKASGYDVISCEIVNDRGVHIMKSMLMYMKYGEGKTPESEKIKPDHFVGKYYAMFAEKAEADPKLDDEAQELLQKWESGDKETRKLWEKMNSWFYQGIKETYAREGSVFDSVEYESEIYDKGREIIMEGLKKGIFKKSDTDKSIAFVYDNNGQEDVKYLLRADGTAIYITQDIYLWSLRNEKFRPDIAMVTTSSEQAYHFAVLKKIFEKLGYKWADSFKHLPYEHVYLGKSKMSSRAGNTVSADELLDMTKEKVRKTMQASQKIKISPDDDASVEAIAFAAIKYAYLKYDRNTKIYFDLEETVAIEGNTGPYIQYAYARIKSILQQAEDFLAKNSMTNPVLNFGELKEPEEISLLRALVHYPESVEIAVQEFKPNLVCSYLFDLCGRFGAFYDKVSVLKAESDSLKAQRLMLIASVAAVIEHGLSLLGIKALDKI